MQEKSFSLKDCGNEAATIGPQASEDFRTPLNLIKTENSIDKSDVLDAATEG